MRSVLKMKGEGTPQMLLRISVGKYKYLAFSFVKGQADTSRELQENSKALTCNQCFLGFAIWWWVCVCVYCYGVA